jgi:hypothetical protein
MTRMSVSCLGSDIDGHRRTSGSSGPPPLTGALSARRISSRLVSPRLGLWPGIGRIHEVTLVAAFVDRLVAEYAAVQQTLCGWL